MFLNRFSFVVLLSIISFGMISLKHQPCRRMQLHGLWAIFNVNLLNRLQHIKPPPQQSHRIFLLAPQNHHLIILHSVLTSGLLKISSPHRSPSSFKSSGISVQTVTVTNHSIEPPHQMKQNSLMRQTFEPHHHTHFMRRKKFYNAPNSCLICRVMYWNIFRIG